MAKNSKIRDLETFPQDGDKCNKGGNEICELKIDTPGTI
jgi:hypothetical protein